MQMPTSNCTRRFLRNRLYNKASQNCKFQKPAPRRGLRVVALDNPYRSGNANHKKNTTLKQTETTTLPSILCTKKIPTSNCALRIPKESPLLRFLRLRLKKPKELQIPKNPPYLIANQFSFN
ncbi:hypothetical protein RCS94_00555 [Orbaceae bacterium ac157xtp]